METKEQKQAYQLAINSYYGNLGSTGRPYKQIDFQKLYQEILSEQKIEKRNHKIDQILNNESTTI